MMIWIMIPVYMDAKSRYAQSKMVNVYINHLKLNYPLVHFLY